jgi:DNA primase
VAGKIPNHFIQELLSRTDIVDLIDSKLPLKRSGANFVARCPFHNEKTPSFSVNRDKQFYYCFGCGAKGTAIGFLMEFDRLNFVEAIEFLADQHGLEVPREDAGTGGVSSGLSSGQLQSLYDVQEQACRFYQSQLKGHAEAKKAVDYLQARGVSGEVALRYRIGYAPPGAQNLPDHLGRDAVLAAGLKVSKEQGRTYDWFRDRVVFPIRDRRGRITGFGGRVIGEGTPKYLNSPETEIFKKHKEVYGLFELLAAIRSPEWVLVVEGYMDVIALAQFGIQQAVACLGTATSSDHVGLLFRHTSEIIFCFDGDLAGRNAAWKALESSLIHLKGVRQIRFLLLPEGHDPDSLVREEGHDAFLLRIKNATPLSDYFFERLAQGLDLQSIEGKAGLVNKARPLLEKIPEGVFRDLLMARLASTTGYSESDMESKELPSGAGNRPSSLIKRAGEPSALRTFMALLVQNPFLAESVDSRAIEALEKLMKSSGPPIGRILEKLKANPHILPSGVLELFRGEQEEDLVGKLMVWSPQVSEDKVKEVFEAYLSHLTENRPRQDRLEELIQKSKREALSPEDKQELRELTTLR